MARGYGGGHGGGYNNYGYYGVGTLELVTGLGLGTLVGYGIGSNNSSPNTIIINNDS